MIAEAALLVRDPNSELRLACRLLRDAEREEAAALREADWDVAWEDRAED